MSTALPAPDVSSAPLKPAEPIHSRFLFVDVAARRAIQLKRGARVRIGSGEHAENAEHDRVRKLERIAIEEVRRGLIQYQVPALPTSVA